MCFCQGYHDGATAMAAAPLMIVTGAGSESRIVLGVVIFSGVLTATLFTLLIVPAFYHLLARHTLSRNSVALRLDELKSGTALSQS